MGMHKSIFYAALFLIINFLVASFLDKLEILFVEHNNMDTVIIAKIISSNLLLYWGAHVSMDGIKGRYLSSIWPQQRAIDAAGCDTQSHIPRGGNGPAMPGSAQCQRPGEVAAASMQAAASMRFLDGWRGFPLANKNWGRFCPDAWLGNGHES
ncbi:hypothetical protein [Janthinobacterium sp. HLS12-2]|uniref:hypothetical protein n=1 Tax=Janthinobacterium sp. HLS12-2 TaxID=1259324 RepID=UPI003F20C1D6